MAGGTMVTRGTGTVVNVLAAVVACPPIDADAVVAAVGVMASPSILARVGHQFALVHILCTVLACVMGRALAVVGVHAVHTHAAILAAVTRTVINVMLTVWTREAWQAATVVGGVSLLDARASILARRGAARHVGCLTVLAGVLLRTAAVVGAHLIDAHTAVEAGGG